jgi:hypothetical protein
MTKNMGKLRGLAVLALIAGGIWLGVGHGGGSGPISRVVGGLRLVSAHAQVVSGSDGLTAQQAEAIIITKLSSQEPTIDWSVFLNDARIDRIPQLTQVYDAFTGRLIYNRSAPVDAWVLQLRENNVTVKGATYALITGMGVVSDNTTDPGCLNRANPACSPPGTLLDADAFVRPH